MGRYLASGKEYVRHHLPQQALVSIMLFAAAPLLAGVRNLSVGETARLLDFYVVLPGMLLLIPVFLPEQDKSHPGSDPCQIYVHGKYLPGKNLFECGCHGCSDRSVSPGT